MVCRVSGLPHRRLWPRTGLFAVLVRSGIIIVKMGCFVGQSIWATSSVLRKDAAIGFITPLASVGSIVILVAALIVQRWTSLQIQRRAEQTSFELNVAELVMSSYSPTAATNRPKLLAGLYSDRLRKGFAGSFDPDIYPGTRKHELQFEVYRLCRRGPIPVIPLQI